jgi:hypothetical protein
VLCLVPVLCVGGIVLILGLVLGMLKSSDVYAEALSRARTNAQVVAQLGEPIQPGYWVTGRLEVSGPSGEAELAIPLSGSKKSATLYAVATKTAGTWQFSTLEVAGPDADTPIDLRTTRTP